MQQQQIPTMPVQYVQPILVQPAAEQKAAPQIPFEKMTLDEKITATQAKVDKTKKRLKCCGVFFLISGFAAVGNAIHSFSNSRDWSSFIAQTGKLPWPANKTTIEAYKESDHSQPTNYEFELYDLLVKVSLLIFIYGVLLLVIGCRSRMLGKWAKRSRFAQGAFRRGVITVVLFSLAYWGMKKQCAHLMDTVEQIDADKNLTSPIDGHRQLRAGHHHHEDRSRFENMDDAWESMRSFKGFDDEVPQKADFTETIMDDDWETPATEQREPSALEAWATRENIYKMFAPKLWKYAREDSEDADYTEEQPEKDMPKKKFGKKGGVCPVMVILYIAMFAQLYLMKCLQKGLAALELYQRAKKIMQEDEANLESGSMLYDNSTIDSIAVVEPEIEQPANLLDKTCDFDYSLEEPKQSSVGHSFSLNFDRNSVQVSYSQPQNNATSGSINTSNQMA